MKSLRLVVIFLVVLSVFAINARADAYHRATVTFSQPVEIPGKVLPQGKYIFEVIDPGAHLVRITDVSGTHVYATLFTVPDYKLRTPEGNLFTFEERAQGAPEAIHSWFLPGNNLGEEFIYPRR